jgi:hypothetical protein
VTDWVGIGAGGGVVLVGAYVAHRLSKHRDRQNARRQAATIFRATVLDELRGLYPKPFEWEDDISPRLRKAAPGLAAAVAQYGPFLPWWQRRGFDKAWSRYSNYTGRKVDLQSYHHYMKLAENPDPQSKFIKNVKTVLSYANV